MVERSESPCRPKPPASERCVWCLSDEGAVAVAAGPIAGGEERTPAGRRGRLAALAHNRDDWEDDLSRHTPK